MKKTIPAVIAWLALSVAAIPQSVSRPIPKCSRCHVFVDYENIWTLEMVENKQRQRVPILNIITLTKGEWELKPTQIHVLDDKGVEARVDKFSIDTGIPEEPYLTPLLRVLANSFIGVDLIGKFDSYGEPAKVQIDLGENRFELQPIDCMDFESLAEKINGLNFDSPNVREDFAVLKLELRGKRSPLPKVPR